MAKDNNGIDREYKTEKEYQVMSPKERVSFCKNLRNMYQDVVDYGIRLLDKNNQNVMKRFNKYYDDWSLAENLTSEAQTTLRKLSKAREFVGLFTSTSKINGFDLRYHGTPFASLKVKGNEIMIVESESHSLPEALSSGVVSERTIEELKNINLTSEDNEACIEAKLLDSLNSTNPTQGIRYIRPITKPDKLAYIQFPSTFNASDAHNNLNNIHYSDPKGGRGLDILARQRGNTLLAIEVKDNYQPNELPEDAIKQAILYATELCYVLRNNKDWFKRLVINKDFEKSMLVKAVIAMPFPENGTIDNICTDFYQCTKYEKLFVSFKGQDGKDYSDRIELHYLFFKKPNSEESINVDTLISSFNS